MKKLVVIIAGTFYVACSVFAQKSDVVSKDNNILRFNASALVFRNISIEYERRLNQRNSLTINFHGIPYGDLPFLSYAQKLIDKVYVDLSLARIGSVGGTASYRFYSAKKGVFNGFYFAPMLNYTSYKTTLPIQYDNGKIGLFNGNINTITGGLQVGVQFKVTGALYVDLWIVGPSYGLSFGSLNFSGPLSVNEQAILMAEIEDLKGSLPIYVISSYKITSTGASISEQGPWAGLRALGVNIGFRF